MLPCPYKLAFYGFKDCWMLKAAAVAGKTTLSKPCFFLKVKLEEGWMNKERSLVKKNCQRRTCQQKNKQFPHPGWSVSVLPQLYCSAGQIHSWWNGSSHGEAAGKFWNILAPVKKWGCESGGRNWHVETGIKGGSHHIKGYSCSSC